MNAIRNIIKKKKKYDKKYLRKIIKTHKYTINTIRRTVFLLMLRLNT